MTEKGSLWIGCIADDFTGGSDAASFLRRAGLEVILIDGDALKEGPSVPPADALVIALKSRALPAAEAVAQSLEAAAWLLDRGARQLYFKYCSTFDSTPRGNIGPVTDALLELLGERYTVLCPSLPVNGRTVRDGVLYVNGVPLAESPMKDHPLNPMRKSDVTALMEEQSAYPCVMLTRERLSTGDPVRGLETGGRFTVVPTYETEEDGEKIAEAFAHLRLLTGGSGLLAHLGARHAGGLRDPEAPGGPGEEADAPRLLLAGSCSDMTQRQVRRYLEQGGRAVRIRPDRLLSGEQTAEALEREIAAAGEAGEDILLYSTAGAAERELYRDACGAGLSALLEALMGRLAAYGRARGFKRLIAAGGETSGALAKALGFRAYRVGREAAPGVPELRPVGDEALRLLLKSGNFGGEDFFLFALRPGHETF